MLKWFQEMRHWFASKVCTGELVEVRYVFSSERAACIAKDACHRDFHDFCFTTEPALNVDVDRMQLLGVKQRFFYKQSSEGEV